MFDAEENGVHRGIATARHIIEMIAIIAAGTWAFYTFIYEERIKPAHEPVSAVETVTVTREGRIRNLDVIRLSLGIRNAGKTELDSVGLEYAIFGYRYDARAKPMTSAAGSYNTENDIHLGPPHLILSHVLLYDSAVGGERDLHNIFEPGSAFSATYYVAIPKGRYDLVRAHFRYLPVRTPVRKRFAVDVHRLTDGSFDLHSPAENVMEDNVYSELALTQ